MNKARYDILDGLRGVAALMVLLFHLFNDAKCFYVWDVPVNEFYHGFLGVDFFFILSGFVMGYAYDRQWDSMSLGAFIKRRLIRLHPMVVMGVLLGLVAFVIQGCTKWDGTHVSVESLMLVTLLGLFMLPSPTSLEVRGYTEAFPLNGPHWSLFFEYLGSLLYGLMLRKLSTKCLKAWVIVSAIAISVFAFTVEGGGIAYGWSSVPENMLGGALRMLYAYPMGLLLARYFREKKVKSLQTSSVFLYCSIALVALLGFPFIYNKELETGYQLFCIMFLFPLIIWLGAKGNVCGIQLKVAQFLGRLSYPLYAIHYPFVYLFITWVGRDGHPYEEYSQPWMALMITFCTSIAVAVLCLLLYDEPLRKRLGSKK